MKKKTPLSENNQTRLSRLKSNARRRLVKSGLVQFRADEEMLDLLMRIADHKKSPLGVMVRDWVSARLAEEARQLPLPAVNLPDGQVLTRQSTRAEIEAVVFAHQQGLIQLPEVEYRALVNWLLDQHLAERYARD